MADARSDVVVIGSCFVDMISYVPRLPKFGETIKGTKFHMGFGGKAANQCVMAQNLGAKTVMIAKLGNDQFGKDTIHNFNRFGVNTQFISVTDEADTGVTNIGKIIYYCRKNKKKTVSELLSLIPNRNVALVIVQGNCSYSTSRFISGSDFQIS